MRNFKIDLNTDFVYRAVMREGATAPSLIEITDRVDEVEYIEDPTAPYLRRMITRTVRQLEGAAPFMRTWLSVCVEHASKSKMRMAKLVDYDRALTECATATAAKLTHLTIPDIYSSKTP